MFGFIKYHFCNRLDDNSQKVKSYYCGVCKTIGVYYNTINRFFLNNDFVFLAFMMDAIKDQPTTLPEEFASKKNCFRYPENKGNIPLSFHYVSAINILYVYLSILDDISDSKHIIRLYRQGLKKLYYPNYVKAARVLSNYDINIDELIRIFNRQIILETELEPGVNNMMDKLAEPTAGITARLFSHGMRLIGKDELIDTFYDIGYQYGKMMYIIDALVDYESDYVNHKFNAIKHIHQPGTVDLSNRLVKRYFDVISDICDKLYAMLAALPIAQKDLTSITGIFEFSKHKTLDSIENKGLAANSDSKNMFDSMHKSLAMRQLTTLSCGGFEDLIEPLFNVADNSCIADCFPGCDTCSNCSPDCGDCSCCNDSNFNCKSCCNCSKCKDCSDCIKCPK